MTFLKYFFSFLVSFIFSQPIFADAIDFDQLNKCYEQTNFHPDKKTLHPQSTFFGNRKQINPGSSQVYNPQALIFHEVINGKAYIHVIQPHQSQTFKMAKKDGRINDCGSSKRVGSGTFVIKNGAPCSDDTRSGNCVTKNLRIGRELVLVRPNYQTKLCPPKITEDRATPGIKPLVQKPNSAEVARKALLDRIRYLKHHLTGPDKQPIIDSHKESILKALKINGPCFKVTEISDLFKEVEPLICELSKGEATECTTQPAGANGTKSKG